MCAPASLHTAVTPQDAPPHRDVSAPRGHRPPPPALPLAPLSRPRPPSENSCHFFKDLFDQAPVAYALWDSEGCLKQINRVGETLLGCPLEEMLDAPFTDFLVPADRKRFREHLALCERWNQAETELRIRHRKGHEVCARVITNSRGQLYSGVLVPPSVRQPRRISVREHQSPLPRSARSLQREISQAREFQRDLLDRSEQQKRRISCDLNDGLCQEIAAASMFCSVLAKRRGIPNSVVKDLRTVIHLLGSMMMQAKQIIHDLTPVQIDEFGLAIALEELSIKTNHTVNCRFLCPAPTKVTDSTVSLNLHQIAESTVAYLLEHCTPTSILIQLGRKGSKVLLQIISDGKKPPAKRPQTIQHYARCIHAALRITSPKKGGVKVACTAQSP